MTAFDLITIVIGMVAAICCAIAVWSYWTDPETKGRKKKAPWAALITLAILGFVAGVALENALVERIAGATALICLAKEGALVVQTIRKAEAKEGLDADIERLTNTVGAIIIGVTMLVVVIHLTLIAIG